MIYTIEYFNCYEIIIEIWTTVANNFGDDTLKMVIELCKQSAPVDSTLTIPINMTRKQDPRS